MFRKEVENRPLLVWLFCGMTAPVVQLLAGYDYRLLALTGAVCTLLLCAGLYSNWQYGKVICALQTVWSILVLAKTVQYAAEGWPMAQNATVISLILLGLAGGSAQKGAAAAARTAGLLLLIIGIGYVAILLVGLQEVNVNWVQEHDKVSAELAVYVFLIPGVIASIPRKPLRGKTAAILVVPLFCVLVTVVTCGNVAPRQQTHSSDFYQMSQSLRLMGLAQRFEALVCGMISIGWFALASLLANGIGANLQKLMPGKAAAGTWGAVCAAAGLVLWKMPMDGRILVIGAVIFWGALPLFTQGIGLLKNIVKK